MAISLQNHENRISVLESHKGVKFTTLFSVPFNKASYSFKLNDRFDRYDFLIIDSQIDFNPEYGVTTSIFSKDGIKTCNNCFCIGNDDDAVVYFKIGSDGMTVTDNGGSQNRNYFYVFRVQGLKLYYNLRAMFKEVSHKWLSL